MVSDRTPLKILVAKPGLDGHDVGGKVVARALRDAGFEVIYSGLHQSPDAIVNTALEEDVHIIGLSILSGAHIPLCRKIRSKMKEHHIDDKILIVGGVIPEKDFDELYSMGVNKIFPTGSKFDDIIHYLREQAA